MKWKRISLRKRLFASMKRHLCMIKWHLDNPEGKGSWNPPLVGCCFWYIWFKFRKIFSKRALFNEESNPRTLHFLYHIVFFINKVLQTLFMPCEISVISNLRNRSDVLSGKINRHLKIYPKIPKIYLKNNRNHKGFIFLQEAEPVARRFSVKKVFLKILQQERV